MWVFDGEEWIEEGGSSNKSERPSQERRELDEFYPELQIVEIPLKREPVPMPFIPGLIP